MTPKEKAKELVDAMYGVTDYQAKQSALVAVNEIIRTLNDDIRDINVVGNILLDLLEWWREVKQEIEKL